MKGGTLMARKWIVYTDGACSNNQNSEERIGAYAAVLFTQFNGKTYKKDISGTVKGATNNLMELAAVYEAIRETLRHDPSETPEVEIFSDSQYVVKGINEWLPGWKQNDWRTKDGKPLSNLNTWKALDLMLQMIDYTLSKVKGDGNNQWNDYCDKLARNLCGSKPKRK
jgi:ribonuclease HI